MKRGDRRQRGFSLVEVLVSLAIFLIASMGLLPLLLNSMQAGERSAVHGEARRLAGEALAVLQAADYASLSAYDGLSYENGRVVVRNRIEDDFPEVGQTCLTVTASWQAAGQTHRYQLQTLRARP